MNAKQQVRYLQIELEKARQEASRLRKALGENSKHARRVDKAYEGALLLATFYAAGIIPSRRYARLKGLTQKPHRLSQGSKRVEGRGFDQAAQDPQGVHRLIFP